MTDVIALPNTSWDQRVTATERELAVDVLERGCVLLFPQLSFLIQDDERQLLSPTVAGHGKNVSLDPSNGLLCGSSAKGAELQRLHNMMDRFATSSRDLLRCLLARYETALEQGRTSFRPVEIVGRRTSWRKDDTRLHVDSFPSSPTQGKRILRIFTNVNPHGQSRNWRLGESFEDVACRYLHSISRPTMGTGYVLNLLGITKSRRTAYDHYMLLLHDRMKSDMAYQSQVAQRDFSFHAGRTWIAFTDIVSHAAMSGQYTLEQTFYLPVHSMLDPSRAPLRILEKFLGRELI